METIHLSFYKSYFVGSIQTQDGIFEIKHLKENKNIIRQIDPNYFPNDIYDELPVTQDLQKTKDDAITSLKSSKIQIPLPEANIEEDEQNNTIITMIIGYSNLIRQSEAGAAAAIALLNLFVSEANTTHRNSNTRIHIHVNEMIELDVRSDRSLRNNLIKMREIEEKRGKGINYDTNNPYHKLIQRRYATSSDIAILITERSTGALCGNAYLLNHMIQSSSLFKGYALGAVGANCLMGTFTHEIGHILGCRHDRASYTSDQIQGLLPYAFAFKDSLSRFRTIMSTSCSNYCPRIFYFSNPQKQIHNINIGKVNLINNTRSLQERAQIVANIFPNNINISSLSDTNLEITNHPQPGKVREKQPLTLRFGVQPSNVQYQWFRNSSLLQGETSSFLNLHIFSYKGDTAVYHAEAFNSVHRVQSKSVTVSFLRKPTLTQDLTPLQVDLKKPAQFSIKWVSMLPSKIHWYKDGQLLPNENKEILLIETTQWIHRGLYSATLLNPQGVTKTKRVHLGINGENKWDILLQDQKNLKPDKFGKIDRDAGFNLKDLFR